MSLSTPLADELLALAWSQWGTLGVSSVAEPSTAAIDLEALVLLTAQLANDDPRLRDEALDWCSRYHGFVCKPRLKQLLKRSTPSAIASFGPFAHALEDYAGGLWPGSAESSTWSLKLSGKSQPPALEDPALLSLRLRSLLGVGARADVLCALLGWQLPTFTAADLVFVGYTKRNVADVLEALAGSGVLRSRRRGNRLLFSWNKYREFSELMKPLPASIPRWALSMKVLNGCLELERSVSSKSERLALIAAAKSFRELAPDIETLGLTPPRVVIGETSWDQVTSWYLRIARRTGSTTPSLVPAANHTQAVG